MWIGQAQRATAAGERIFEIVDEPEAIAEPENARELPRGPGEVRFEAVSFSYFSDDRLVLDGIDLLLEPGKTVALIGGAIITETVFGWSGMGRFFNDALKIPDPNAVMGFFLVTGTAIVVFNMIADITYGFLDPRIRLS